MSTSPQNGTIVITGCSSGFGRITALHLANLGWHVFATVRKEADQASLLSEATTRGCRDKLTALLCDITRAEQVAALGQAVSTVTPRLDALLNNAGTGYAAPLELLPLDDLRAQLEINVIAHLAVTQVLLPLLKPARGVIINVSSVHGRLPVPITGAYSASKFALEALSDVLRIELAPFGVCVVVIEPSASGTNIWETSIQRARARLEQHLDGPYGRLLNTGEAIVRSSVAGGFPPQLFADTVLKILTSRHPRARYVVPGSARREMILHQLLPDRVWDWLLRRVFKW